MEKQDKNHTQPEDINSQEGVELQPSAVQVETSGRDTSKQNKDTSKEKEIIEKVLKGYEWKKNTKEADDKFKLWILGNVDEFRKSINYRIKEAIKKALVEKDKEIDYIYTQSEWVEKKDILKKIDAFIESKKHLYLVKDFSDEWEELRKLIEGEEK